MKIQGLLIIIVAALLPLIWYAPLAATQDSAAMLSQYAGSVALILMGITQLLATRIRGIEALFGSMDRVYVLHKWLAVGALITSFLHAQIDADSGNIVLVRSLSDLAEGVGEVGYNGLIVLTLASLITIIPYKLWKWSHRLIGIPFALVSLHYLFISKPFAVFDPLGLYISAFCLMGVLSYAYLLIPRALGHSSKRYEVTDVQRHGDIAEIHLQPKGRGIKHKAGQFTFVNFDPANLREVHPYTISSAPDGEGGLRLMVKGLGSYTKRLGRELQVGTLARVSRAQGHFTLRETSGPQVWVGGGIGVTPFLAWAQALGQGWTTPTRLYYCVSSAENAPLLDELTTTANTVDAFNLSLIASKRDGRLTADRIVRELSQDIRDAHVFFCGPIAMRDALKRDLVKRGLRPGNFHVEEFEIRGGVGLGSFARRFMPKLTPKRAQQVLLGSK